jgi:hypothetical protein
MLVLEIALLDLVEHLLDLGSRARRLVSVAPLDRGKLLLDARLRVSGACLAQPLAHPLSSRQPLAFSDPLDLPELVVIEQDLETLSHLMMLSDSLG